MAGKDEQLEEWIIRDGLKKERRSRIVPASTERLDAEAPGEPEKALEAVAAWLSAEHSLPLVEMANLAPRSLNLSFAEPTVLPSPWVSQAGDPEEPHDQWGITLQHAMGLPQGDGYGWQMAGLTGIGTLAGGSRGFLNTSRWEALGIAGTPEWTRALMLTQVMNQAVEPWSAEHDIWLIGYGDTAEKLTSFLAPYHPAHRFHIAESLADLKTEDLVDTTATLYVRGASAETETQFRALRTSGVGMVTDEIVSDEAMFLSEREDGLAVLGPMVIPLEIYPNISPELIEKMERSWQANEELIAQKAAAADFSELLEQSAEPAAPVKSAAEINADFEALMSNADVEGFNTEPAPEAPEEEPEPQRLQDAEEEPAEKTDLVSEDVPEVVNEEAEKDGLDATEDSITADPEGAPEPDAAEVSDSEPVTAQDEGTEDAAEETAPSTDTASDAPNAGNTSSTSSASSPGGADLFLSVFGAPRAVSGVGELKGRPAETLTLLHLAGETIPVQQISEAIWPGDETEGHTARTRRSRLLKKLREHVGEAISITDEGWQLKSGHAATDFDRTLDVITNEPLDRTEIIAEACQRIDTPLTETGEWSQTHRAKITAELLVALEEMKERATEAQAHDIVRTARAATVKLGEV